MDRGKYKEIIEALLFMTSNPLSTEKLAGILEIDEDVVQELVGKLKEEYSSGHGIILEEVGGGFRMATKKEYGEYIQKLLDPPTRQRLSQAALETLAIIAYKQPITRSEIEEIRGVKVEKALLTLGKRGLIKELGRLETIGNPIIYGTTDKFLEHFGLNDLSELPDPEDFGLPVREEVEEISAASGKQVEEITAAGGEQKKEEPATGN